MHVIFGLGNPGRQYRKTRHNLGFLVVDQLSLKWDAVFSRGHALFEHCLVLRDSHRVMLVKPQTFMNRSGEAVRLILDAYRIHFEKLLVVIDDIALPLGRLRMRPDGSDGGHNGLASIIREAGSTAFARLRLGVGCDPDVDASDYVLSPFEKDEEPEVQTMIINASDAVSDWIQHGILYTMNHYNR
ncbi:MAG TPA: aminoacyl-tRNA hydrolase [bacterium]|nr:aminoacyl-tRNA hydrolase [bacterium]